MADMESTYYYPVVETVIFPENWLDELEQDSGTSPTVSGTLTRGALLEAGQRAGREQAADQEHKPRDVPALPSENRSR